LAYVCPPKLFILNLLLEEVSLRATRRPRSYSLVRGWKSLAEVKDLGEIALALDKDMDTALCQRLTEEKELKGAKRIFTAHGAVTGDGVLDLQARDILFIVKKVREKRQKRFKSRKTIQSMCNGGFA
jgi:hypothetical protein